MRLKILFSIALLGALLGSAFYLGRQSVPPRQADMDDTIVQTAYATMTLEDAVAGDREKQIRSALTVIHGGVNGLLASQTRTTTTPLKHEEATRTLAHVKRTLQNVVTDEGFAPHLQDPIVVQLAKLFSLNMPSAEEK